MRNTLRLIAIIAILGSMIWTATLAAAAPTVVPTPAPTAAPTPAMIMIEDPIDMNQVDWMSLGRYYLLVIAQWPWGSLLILLGVILMVLLVGVTLIINRK